MEANKHQEIFSLKTGVTAPTAVSPGFPKGIACTSTELYAWELSELPGNYQSGRTVSLQEELAKKALWHADDWESA